MLNFYLYSHMIHIYIFMRWRNIVSIFVSVWHLFHICPLFLLKIRIRSQKAPPIGPGIKLRGDDAIMPGPGWLLFCRCSSNSNTSNYTKSHNKWETLNLPTKAKKIQSVTNTITLINTISNVLQSSQHEIVSSSFLD